ncbi:hypothetical protein TWF696_005673 [Orbilia brochopaga]|uniref:Proteophosphoglycan ppg4 n=1 Tax=Orbilia brochopaga TaxID=3140254 RepID=A0AAV9UU26_9PEZI
MTPASPTPALLSPTTLATLTTPFLALSFTFFYLSLGTCVFATVETLLGVIRKDDQSAGWWRRSRLVALTYAQMYLSEHFLRIVTAEKTGIALPEKTFWMASQTVATAVFLASTIKSERAPERILIGQICNIERPQVSQVVMTLVVALNVYNIAGAVPCILSLVFLLGGLDWRLLVLGYEASAIWNSSKGNALAEVAWYILHLVLAIGCLKAVTDFDEQEGLIALPADEEKAVAAQLEEHEAASEIESAAEQTGELELIEDACPTAVSAGRLSLIFSSLTILSAALIMMFFFGAQRYLATRLSGTNVHAHAEALALSQLFSMDIVGVLLVLVLTVREVCQNPTIKCIFSGLLFDSGARE